MDNEYAKTLKAAMMRDRKFQDQKFSELRKAHMILDDDSLDCEQKRVMLIYQGWGEEQARKLAYAFNKEAGL